MLKQRIMIVGHGFVGQAVDYGFSNPYVEKTVVDPKYDQYITDYSLLDFDCIFVCVPTPMGDDGSIDSSIINDVVGQLRQVTNIPIVIKSTVTPDIIEQWNDIPNIVYNPEFLTEKSAKEDFINPQFHVLGGSDAYTQDVEDLYVNYSLCNPCPVYRMTAVEASFVKYSINCFLALKVTFFNQLYDAVGETNGNFNKIVNAIGQDSRIGTSHTKVPGFDGKQGYGGACFPKDTAAFTNYSNCLTLLEEAIRINNGYRSQYELDDREREQNVHYG